MTAQFTATASPDRSVRRARRSARPLGLALATGLAVLLVAACAAPPDSTRLMDDINNDRGAHLLAALGPNWPLINKAGAQAQAMAAAGTIFHSNLAADNPYAWRSLAENVAEVPSSGGVDAANFAFLNSPQHKANMENPAFNYVGAASYDDGRGTLWVVEEFMQL
jgi:uncharacterized protein YkwD